MHTELLAAEWNVDCNGAYWTLFLNRDLSQSERAKFGIMDNLVRFSFGVEDYEDLEADVLQALEAI